ncbi:protein arginine N-methyltransferase 1-like [Platysternon megacephalum]|uniref:Protein arginine N-methyltransferase 1-like n=1 Tax=Platysternon megacephalum TaxID=55544 RepID=A0A4D9DLA4_9SAUR|nr:protein arginine N-methyltransferase 1-like [Platysternon megacephalum]
MMPTTEPPYLLPAAQHPLLSPHPTPCSTAPPTERPSHSLQRPLAPHWAEHHFHCPPGCVLCGPLKVGQAQGAGNHAGVAVSAFFPDSCHCMCSWTLPMGQARLSVACGVP